MKKTLRFAPLLGAFALLLPSTAQALLITEIDYHPAEVDDRPFEFIELYNELPDPLDLTGYRICNGVDFEIPPGTWLDGHELLVVAAVAQNIVSKYGIDNVIGDWYTDPGISPSLANGGERIDVCGPGGVVVATVSYNDRGNWKAGADGTGHTLELESPFVELDDPDSWDLSNDIGGSPGLPNPCWNLVVSPGPGGGGPVGTFTEHLDVGLPCAPGDTTFATGTQRYTITGSGNDIWQGGDQFHYAYVKVNGDFDARAHLVSRTWGPSQWGKGGIMARQDLTSSSRYYFVHDNPDPDGARVAMRATHGGSDNAEPSVLAGATHPNWYRLTRVGNTMRGYYSDNGAAWTEFAGGDLAWAGGSIVHLGFALTSHSNCDTATLVWDSLSISGTILPPDDPGPGPGPTPGVCLERPPVRLSEAYLRTVGAEPRWVELVNESASAINLEGYYLTDDPTSLKKHRIPAGNSIASEGFKVFTEAQLGFDLSIAMTGDRRFLALVEPDPSNRVIDAYTFEPEFPGYSEARIAGDARSFSRAADPTQGAPNVSSVITSVVINEIMYHPTDDDDRKEYVELYNRGGVAVDLTGWSLSNGVRYDFPPGTTIAAGGYLVLARDPSLIRSIYGLGIAVVLGPGTPAELAAFGGLKNGGERITLSDQLGRTADTVRYHDGGEWPEWPDGGGSSLELIDASQDNSVGQAWDASDDSAKATAQTFSYSARHGNRDTEMTFALMDAGIALVDDVSVLAGGVTVTDTPLVDFGVSGWRYFEGTQEPPADWSTTGFADGSWLSGTTGIGYGDNDDTTVLDNMQNNYMSIYCRKTFTLADKNAVDQLFLSVVIDDGFYAYLNGTPVFEYNVAGTAFDAPAPSAIEPTTIEQDLTAFKGLLVNGTNVIAFHVHNAGLPSSDLSFNPRLVSRTTTVGGGGTEHITNGTFNSNTTGWVIEGTHVRSGRTTQSPLNGAGSLKILASGRGDNKVNRIETPTAGGVGMSNIAANEDVIISFKGRWVVGSKTVLTNGFDHEMARSHEFDVPLDLGTPGARNQVTQRRITQTGSQNLGPVITKVSQAPIVPDASEPVIVRARVLDSDGVSAVRLFYSLNNPSVSPTQVVMTSVGGGYYEGTIPQQALNTRVVFYITATDTGSRVGRYPVDITQRTHPLLLSPPTAGLNDQRYLVYRHDVKDPPTNYLSYRFYMTQANEDELSNRRLLSNDRLEGSFLFGSQDIYYESNTRFSGSPWARAGWNGSFRVGMPGDKPLHGRINKFGLEDNQGNPIDARTRVSHYLIRQQNQGGAAVPYTDSFALVRWQVNSRTTGTREHNWVPDGDFISRWFPQDDSGDFLEMDDRFLINDSGARQDSADGRVLYPPPYRTNDADGTNKENYRWFFGLRAKNGSDQFANFIAYAKVMDPSRTSDALFGEQIWDTMNVEEMLRIWAVEMNIDDWDSWGQSRGKNCYFYRPDSDGRFHLIGWDFELTYGDVNSFIIPASPSSAFNPGGFAEVNRLMNIPKIRRMYYSILDEMVNGPDRWFHSSYLSEYATRLAAFGMANTGIAQPGGYVDQKAALLQARIQSVVYPQVRLQITTNGGNNFSSALPTVSLQGTAPTEVCAIYVNDELYPIVYSSMTNWSIAGIPLAPGANNLQLFGFDLRGRLIDSDSIVVTSTATWNAPAITSLNPATELAGNTIEVLGTDFHNGVKVFFGAVQSASAQYDENGPTPGRIVARVPSGSGVVNVTVRNLDNQTSNARSFTYLVPPPMFVRSDANGDGVTDISDGIKVLLYLFSGAVIDCEDALDIDDSETINVTDAIGIFNYLFKGGVAPRAPFPTAGTDPAGTTLGCSR